MSKYACAGILPCLIYPSTAKAAADELLAHVENTNRDVTACAGLDDTTRANWGTYYATVKPFLQESPGAFGLGTRMDRIASYADDLYDWQLQLKGRSCATTLPIADPNAVPPETNQLINLAHWGLYTVIAVAGAYGISKVVEVIPKPGPAGSPRTPLSQRLGGHVGRAHAAVRRALA